MIRRFRNLFVAGLIVLLPVAVTITVFWNVFVKVDSFLGELIARYTGVHVPGAGFVAMILLITLVGLFASNFIGRRLIGFGEWFLVKVPFVNKIYTGVKQIAGVIFAEKRSVFKEAVLIEYPKSGVYSVAFLTNDEIEDEFPIENQGPLVTVFLPTTPNPTSGFLLIIPRKDTIPLSFSIEEAIKLVISGGSVLPEMVKRPATIRKERTAIPAD